MWAWRSSWSCYQDHFLQNLCSLFPRRFHIKFDLDWPCDSEKKIFENNGHIHVYSPGAGANNNRCHFLFQKCIVSVYLVICCKFITFNYFVTVFPI